MTKKPATKQAKAKAQAARDAGYEVTVAVMIEGVSPLQMHKYNDEAALKIMERSGKVRTGEKATPRQAAEQVAYIDGRGKPYLPAENLFQCIVGAGKHIKHGRAKLTNAKTSIIPAIVDIVEDVCPVLMRNGAGFIPAEWQEWLASPTNATGGKSPLWRPIFFEWYISLTLRIDTEEIPLSMARTLIDKAGKFQGLGPQRVERKGRYGKFRVCNWEIQE